MLTPRSGRLPVAEVSLTKPGFVFKNSKSKQPIVRARFPRSRSMYRKVRTIPEIWSVEPCTHRQIFLSLPTHNS